MHWNITSLDEIRDWPKHILLVSAVAEMVAETRDTYTAVTERQTKCLGLVSAKTVAKTEGQRQISHRVFTTA